MTGSPRAIGLPATPRFRHVVFPHARWAGRVVDVAAMDESFATRDSTVRLSHGDVQFLKWLFATAGLDVANYRPETLSRRLSACLRALRVPDVATARSMLERSPTLTDVALSAVLVGVTSFFRDRHVFDALQREFLPALGKKGRNLHVWSAGCSDGSELYSVAMLLAEADLLGRSYLLGTDCRADAIATARRGRYPASALEHVPQSLESRYFCAAGPELEIVRPLRNATRWRVSNAVQAAEPGQWDLILCRNTSIYLRSHAAKALWDNLDAALRPGGILILGRAERPWGVKRLLGIAPCIFRKTMR